MDIITFLNARLDEEETAACTLQRTWPGPWEVIVPDPNRDETIIRDASGLHLGELVDYRVRPEYDREVAHHIARWNPDRMIAEIAARRTIVLNCSTITLWGWPPGTGGAAYADALTKSILLPLAQPYSGHPDFDPAWKVTQLKQPLVRLGAHAGPCNDSCQPHPRLPAGIELGDFPERQVHDNGPADPEEIAAIRADVCADCGTRERKCFAGISGQVDCHNSAG